LSLLIELKNITKIYQQGPRQTLVLKGIDFALKSGELLGLIGASGSGKSTLMHILGFLDQATSGTYLFQNEEVSALTDEALAAIRNKKIGFVFQSFFLLPRLTLLQNVLLPLFYRNENKKIATQKAMHLLKKVGMDTFYLHKPNELSGGQQQRVAIARALVGDPDVIFADEPTGSLDSETSKEVMALFLRLNQEEKRSIVLITHDQAISRQCHRVVRLRDGMVCDDFA